MLENHVRHLEEKIQVLRAQLIERQCNELERRRIEAEIQLAERALAGYRAAILRKQGRT